MEPYFNDYKLNLIEIAFMTNEEIERLTGAFRLLASLYTRANEFEYPVHDEILEDPEEAYKLARQFALDISVEELGWTGVERQIK